MLLTEQTAATALIRIPTLKNEQANEPDQFQFKGNTITTDEEKTKKNSFYNICFQFRGSYWITKMNSLRLIKHRNWMIRTNNISILVEILVWRKYKIFCFFVISSWCMRFKNQWHVERCLQVFQNWSCIVPRFDWPLYWNICKIEKRKFCAKTWKNVFEQEIARRKN